MSIRFQIKVAMTCDGSKVVPVQGFGFFTECVRDNINNIFKVKCFTEICLIRKVQLRRKADKVWAREFLSSAEE